MKTIEYPRRDANPEAVFTQHTFDLAHAHIMSWRQAAGAFGEIQHSACWSESSSLNRRYQGQTIASTPSRLRGFLTLFERTKQARWRVLAEDVVSNILFLQTPRGGFYHASKEYEPTYTGEQSCPIHQGLPLLALLDYAGWPGADPARKDLCREAIDAHWRWFEKHWWCRGNPWKGKLTAGFCGVTNQDLVIAAALARYAEVFGDASRYDQFGRPTVEMYLGPDCYHERLGLFERGDRANFVERTGYYDIIIPMFRAIHKAMPDPRIPAVIDNVSSHLFDATVVGPDQFTHLAWGAETLDGNRERIHRWIPAPYVIATYPGLLQIMKEYLDRHDDPERRAVLSNLERTIAAYTLADGGFPLALRSEDPLLSTASQAESLWQWLMKRLGDNLQSPAPVELPCIHRSLGAYTYQSNENLWAIYRDGKRLFAGLKVNPGGIAIGPDEKIAGADFDALSRCDIVERIHADSE